MQERETKRMANPDAEGWPDDDYSTDLGHGNELVDHADATEETRAVSNHESLPGPIADLDRDDRDRLVILVDGTQLRQGSTYVDLDDLRAGPFVAIGGQRAERGRRLVPKHRIGYDLWNRIVGQDAEPSTVRPTEERQAARPEPGSGPPIRGT